MRSRTKAFICAAVCAAGMLAITGTASATFHENVIREVHDSTVATGDYVELQAYAAGQNLVGGKFVNFYDGGGTIFKSVPIPSNVANAANQATILLADDASVSGADVVNTDVHAVDTGGTVCFSTSSVGTAPALDCVAYTSGPTTFPATPPSPFGTPIALPGGNLDGKTLIRSISRGCPTLLEAADDTNNSAADFTVGTGNPRGNAVTPTESACPAAPSTTKKCKKHKKHHKTGHAAKKHKKKCKKKKHKK